MTRFCSVFNVTFLCFFDIAASLIVKNRDCWERTEMFFWASLVLEELHTVQFDLFPFPLSATLIFVICLCYRSMDLSIFILFLFCFKIKALCMVWSCSADWLAISIETYWFSSFLILFLLELWCIGRVAIWQPWVILYYSSCKSSLSCHWGKAAYICPFPRPILMGSSHSHPCIIPLSIWMWAYINFT